MYLKGWFLTWSKNNSLPNSSLDHISRYNQSNLNIMNVNEMIVNTTNLRCMIVTKNEQCMKNQTNLFNKNKIYNPKIFFCMLLIQHCPDHHQLYFRYFR